MAGRSELENSPSYGEISSSTLWALPYREETVACQLSVDTPRNNENPPSLPRGSPNKILRNRGAWTQLRKTSTRDHRRRARMGGGKDYQLPTPRTTQEAPIPCSVEGIPTIRRFLGSRVGSFRSGPNRRLLHQTLPRPLAIVI